MEFLEEYINPFCPGGRCWNEKPSKGEKCSGLFQAQLLITIEIAVGFAVFQLGLCRYYNEDTIYLLGFVFLPFSSCWGLWDPRTGGSAVAPGPQSQRAEQHCQLMCKQQSLLSSQGHNPTHSWPGSLASLLRCWCAKLFMFPACQELSMCPHGLQCNLLWDL